MPFYTYDQNNSGRSFAFDEQRGITAYVIIEAFSETHADHRAESIGLYWDGCSTGVAPEKEAAVHYLDGRIEWFGVPEARTHELEHKLSSLSPFIEEYNSD